MFYPILCLASLEVSVLYFKEINVLSSMIELDFIHVGLPANSFAYYLAKQGVERSSPFVGFTS